MQKIVAILMSFMLLLSSSGISYAQHFCGEHEMMAKITLGEKHLSCGMAMELPGCDDETEPPGCCDNEYTKVDTDDNFAKADTQFEYINVATFATVSIFNMEVLVENGSTKNIYLNYRPPPLDRDLQVLYETFII